MRIPVRGGVTLGCAAVLAMAALGRADDPVELVRKAVEQSTLNQSGTRPFHLKAELAPSFARDRASKRTGDVEIWWASPTRRKSEVRSPEFHQIATVDGDKEWQKTEGEYFPEWLREASVALVDPIPSEELDRFLDQVKEGDVKKLGGITNFTWEAMSTDGNVQMALYSGVSITDKTGLLASAWGLGFGGSYKDFKSFHGRAVARTVTAGSPEVTATITVLEELGDVEPNFFDTAVAGGDPAPFRTVVIDELTLRKNLISAVSPIWPVVPDGPLSGSATTEVVVDRAGKVRYVGTIACDNPALSETFGKTVAAMQFNPFTEGGTAVQVVSRITMPFKSARPAGVESFDSAHDYFEHGRQISSPAAGNGGAYILRATFQARIIAGTIEDGTYVDTWKKDDEWRREVTIGKSRCVRARHGETRYQLIEGPDAGILRFVLKAMEPIPTIDTFLESDWRIKRDSVNGVKTIRVLAGFEDSQGKLDPQHTRAYWFDDQGDLLKTYFSGLETLRSDFAEFDGARVAHTIRVLQNGSLGLVVRVTSIATAENIPEVTFEVPRHEWKRAFTDEVR
jgi:hypothetical protein